MFFIFFNNFILFPLGSPLERLVYDSYMLIIMMKIIVNIQFKSIFFCKIINFMSNFIFLSSVLFIIGSLGMFLVRKHIIIILISFELIVLAINMNFIFASVFLDDLTGQIFSILILTVALLKVQ